MNIISSKIFEGKITIRLKDRVCETSEELLSSDLFAKVLKLAVKELEQRDSIMLDIFEDKSKIRNEDISLLIETFQFLYKMPIHLVPNVVEGSRPFLRNPYLLNDFLQYLYNFWRHFNRFIICNSNGDMLDKRPYRTFHSTIEQLGHLVRKTYRDLQDNITGNHPNVYRQVVAGAEIATVCITKNLVFPGGAYEKLRNIPVIRQVLLYPPLVLNPPMNKRKGKFERVGRNPLELIDIKDDEWLCYPAKVGPLVIYIYFQERFFELGFSMANLFDIADDKDLERKPNAVFLFGTPGDAIDSLAPLPTVFYDDEENDLLVGAIPNRDEFGYFGYLKKMALTLHNIRMMKSGKLPFHGALFRIVLRGDKEATVLVMGDTGAGKSETLEAFRVLGAETIRDIIIIADDMGSLGIDEAGNIIGYGTEVGAYVRLDDLQPGYAFGQIDRMIIMNPNQTNARIVLPVTSPGNVLKGHKIDFVLYCNNYEEIDEEHPVIERFASAEEALQVFRAGAVMSKGTTAATGLVHSYFANVFGPPQYRQLHDELAKKYFDAFMAQGLFIGQMRTRLGIPGWERNGPEASAKELLKQIQNR
ncbi:Hypothetical protein LUCI_1581 [Lucifera butyrica]|uniref:Phosphoenolpyruvate carboxykinase n=1 Tax=Lucifera butyrica TaxID=1351585 RepID=A0A498R663_9FIRM|nr:phosphoenolpyruvate carboxykinase [Lucifera butyrica]VBB06350.1 Hypothetical protein LUCI_1581 [Lucifera butyrica]